MKFFEVRKALTVSQHTYDEMKGDDERGRIPNKYQELEILKWMTLFSMHNILRDKLPW